MNPSPTTRLAVDRYLLGVWGDRELLEFLKQSPQSPLAPLAQATTLDRPREARRLRAVLLGAERPTDTERLEALIREGVDRTEQGMTILTELQHDLTAHVTAVAKDDARAEAVRALADLAAASQVHVSIQSVGAAAERSLDRVQKARELALTRLQEILRPFPHLAPRG